MNISQIEEAFHDIILGNGVKRSVHDLVYDNADYSNLFISCLKRNNFFPLTLKHTIINPGFRYPGFYLMDSVAYFGHLFWEVFSDSRKRKIWGSIVRNEKGDWKYILPGNSSKIIYINKDKIQAVDIFHLT